jgi:hypothetical protein
MADINDDMETIIWARLNVIQVLSGFSMRRVRRDIEKYNWPVKRRPGSPLKYYDLRAVERSLRYRFTPAQIQSAVNELTRPVLFVEN